jgi:hypothetical protein
MMLRSKGDDSCGAASRAGLAQGGRAQNNHNADEIARRRTFAIISHPDAGKTTLTERLLRAGGAIQLAGNEPGRIGCGSSVSAASRSSPRS